MIILSHRGYWKSKHEKNQPIAFERSFCLNFGTETDIRDYDGELVISHDIADESCITVEDFFGIYNNCGNGLPLALNIKSDGLQEKLKEYLQEYKISNYFVFDMTVPDEMQYLRHNVKSFSRESEYERHPAFYKQSEGVWLDEFHSHWISQKTIERHVNNDKKICIVSPDLHKRGFEKEWRNYKSIEKKLDIELSICTDYPEKARDFFNE